MAEPVARPPIMTRDEYLAALQAWREFHAALTDPDRPRTPAIQAQPRVKHHWFLLTVLLSFLLKKSG